MGNAQNTGDYPVRFSMDYPESLSRGTLLLKTFLGWLYVGIPHGIILALYGIAVGVMEFIAWWAVLFTGRYPRGIFDFVISYMRWSIRVGAYTGFFTDSYPPFNGDENVEGSPVRFSVDYPESLSRGTLLLRAFFGWLYVGIPHGIILFFLGIAAGIIQFVAWWAILFNARYPQGMFEFVINYWRWSLRVNAYMAFLTDIYPPFTGEEQ